MAGYNRIAINISTVTDNDRCQDRSLDRIQNYHGGKSELCQCDSGHILVYIVVLLVSV